MPLKNKNKMLRNILFLLATTTVLPKKPDTEKKGNNLDLHLDIVSKIDTILNTQNPPSPPPTPPIEPRTPLHKLPTLTELEFQTTQPDLSTVPEEFKNEDGTFSTPSFTFIKKLPESADSIFIDKPTNPHVEIIDLSTLSKQASEMKQPTIQNSILKKQKDSKQHTNNQSSSAIQKEKEKNNIYYKKSKHFNENDNYRDDQKQSYIPAVFGKDKETQKIKLEDNQEQGKEQKQQEQQTNEQQKTKQKKSRKNFKPILRIKFTKKPKDQQNQIEKQKIKQSKQILLQQQKKEKQEKKRQLLQAQQQRLKEKKQQKKQKQALIKQLQNQKKQNQKKAKEQLIKQLEKQKQEKKRQLLQAKQQKKKEQPQQKKETENTYELQTSAEYQQQPSPLEQDAPKTLADEDVIKVLLITDDLLGKLPDEVIQEFVQSDDFKLYEKVLSKYKTT